MEQYFSPLPVVERSGVCRCHFRTPAKGDPLVGRMPALSLRAILGGGHLEQAVRARPTNAVAFHGLGSAYVMLDRNEEALAAWETAERLAPNSPNQFNLSAFMGGALFKMGRLEAALERFDHSSRLQPPFYFPLAGRAVLFDRVGKHEAALAELRRARALNPDDGEETLFRSMQAVFRMMWHRNPDQLVLLATLQTLWDATKGDDAS